VTCSYWGVSACEHIPACTIPVSTTLPQSNFHVLLMDACHLSRLHVEQNGRSARHRVPSLISFSSLFLFVFSSLLSPHARHSTILQGATQDGYDLRVPIMALPALTAPLLFSYLSSFLYPTHVVSRSQTAFTSTKQLSRGMRMHIHPSYFILPFMCLYSLYSITITGVPEVTYNTDLRGSTHVYKTVILLVEEGIDPNQAAPVFSLIGFSATALWNRSTDLCRVCSLNRPLFPLAFHPSSLGTSYSPTWLSIQDVIRNLPQVQAPVLDTFSTQQPAKM
jgi:hypothetical protein